jgi:hypothetical protein
MKWYISIVFINIWNTSVKCALCQPIHFKMNDNEPISFKNYMLSIITISLHTNTLSDKGNRTKRSHCNTDVYIETNIYMYTIYLYKINVTNFYKTWSTFLNKNFCWYISTLDGKFDRKITMLDQTKYDMS